MLTVFLGGRCSLGGEHSKGLRTCGKSNSTLWQHLEVSRMFTGHLVTHNRREAWSSLLVCEMPCISEKVLIPQKRKEKRPRWDGGNNIIMYELKIKQASAHVLSIHCVFDSLVKCFVQIRRGMLLSPCLRQENSMQIGSLSTEHRGQTLATVPSFYLKVTMVGASLLEFRESQ